jgi:hypothetical protein
MTGPLVLWGGVTNTDPTQLDVPSLAASPPVDTLTTRTYTVSVAGPDSWPGGVTVQVQTRRGAAAFATVATTATTTALVLPREATQYTVDVRGLAINGGTLTDSDPSAVLTLTIPAAISAVTSGTGTPLRWRTRVFPTDVQTGQYADPLLPTLLPLRAFGSNRIVVDTIEDPERPDRITPTAVTWQATTSSGVVLGSGALTNSGTDWRVTLNQMSTDFRLLDISVTAPDASVTTVRYPVSLVPA